jgi:hypothetical protein
MLGWNRIATRAVHEAGKAREDAMGAVDAGRELCEGYVQLEITSFESFRQINKCTRYLSAIKNLSIVSENWSEDEGFKIFLLVQVPMALERLLEDMPEVARVSFHGHRSGFGGLKKGYQKMVVEMRVTEAALEPVLA